MSLNKEQSQIMFKLARGKGNWGAKYDRLEHFKRFQDLDKCVKELLKKEWVIFHKKLNYSAISLNPRYKSEIINFIEENLPHLKGAVN